MAGHAFRRGFRFSIASDNPPDESSVACRRFLGDGVAALGNGGVLGFVTLAPHTSKVQPWRLRLHLRPRLVFGGGLVECSGFGGLLDMASEGFRRVSGLSIVSNNPPNEPSAGSTLRRSVLAPSLEAKGG